MQKILIGVTVAALLVAGYIGVRMFSTQSDQVAEVQPAGKALQPRGGGPARG